MEKISFRIQVKNKGVPQDFPIMSKCHTANIAIGLGIIENIIRFRDEENLKDVLQNILHEKIRKIEAPSESILVIRLLLSNLAKASSRIEAIDILRNEINTENFEANLNEFMKIISDNYIADSLDTTTSSYINPICQALDIYISYKNNIYPTNKSGHGINIRIAKMINYYCILYHKDEILIDNKQEEVINLKRFPFFYDPKNKVPQSVNSSLILPINKKYNTIGSISSKVDQVNEKELKHIFENDSRLSSKEIKYSNDSFAKPISEKYGREAVLDIKTDQIYCGYLISNSSEEIKDGKATCRKCQKRKKREEYTISCKINCIVCNNCRTENLIKCNMCQENYANEEKYAVELMKFSFEYKSKK